MKKIALIGMFIPMLILTACGEGYEMRSYNNTPYGDRTAGSGIEYVRGMMMREKGPKVDKIKSVKPVKMEQKKPITKTEPLKKKDEGIVDRMLNSGEKFFRDLHKK